MNINKSLSLLTFLFAICLQSVPVEAQPIHTEVVKSISPEADSRPNSDTVPDVFAIEGEFEKTLVLRFKYKADLLKGIEEMVEVHNIKNAVILAGIGSATSYHIHTVSNGEFPSKNIYIKDPKAPVDITSINGYIIDGRVHAHITLADENKALGGHLEPGTNIFTFAIVTVGVFKDGIDLSKVDDKTYR